MTGKRKMNYDDPRSFLRPGERLDDLQLNDLHIIQNPSLFCFSADSVCLSDFAKIKKNESVLDLCTGSGIIPILLSAKTEGRHFTGLELQREMAEMAQRSVSAPIVVTSWVPEQNSATTAEQNR